MKPKVFRLTKKLSIVLISGVWGLGFRSDYGDEYALYLGPVTIYYTCWRG